MKQLKANSIDTANMDDAAMLDAYESMLQANAAETTAQGEQSQPDVLTMVNEAVKAAMKDMKDDEDMDEKKKMAEKLKSNSVELSESEIKALSVNSLQAMLDKASAPAPAFGLAGSASLQNNSDDSDLYDTLPE
jgi:GDP-D-mannose dehydratase